MYAHTQACTRTHAHTHTHTHTHTHVHSLVMNNDSSEPEKGEIGVIKVVVVEVGVKLVVVSPAVPWHETWSVYV